jgi:protein-S-isoprenylcysteine O-methyltransferase Ste14
MPGYPLARSGSRLRLLNALASAAVVALASGGFAVLPVHQGQLEGMHGPVGFAFSGMQFLVVAATVYALIVAGWMMTEREPGVSKSLRAFELAWWAARAPREALRQGLSPDDRTAVLATLLKAFFGPLMAVSLMGFCMAAWVNGSALLQAGFAGLSGRQLFDRFGFWFLMQAILFVDVLIFTVGYLFESRRRGNAIRSVDPSWVGWAAALLCYPPFNAVTAQVLGAQVSDFPQFENASLHIVLNLMLLVLMAMYASASVAMGLKASNLTHRGIVTRGPYAWVRHPAYVCKNLAWWIGAAPLVSQAFELGLLEGLQSLASVLGWSLLYVLRALTEEDHLRQVDGEYAAYANRVRYRFLPGIV